MKTRESEGTGSGSGVHPSPSLLWLAVAHVSLFLASLVVGAVMTKAAPVPTPFQSGETIRLYVKAHHEAIRIVAFLQFGAAIPLGLYSATVSSRLRFLGITAAGVTIAQFGGFMASTFLALSGLIGWTLSRPDMSSTAVSAHILELISFASGGTGCIVPLGLLLAGVSVPGFILKVLPRWLAVLGLFLAIVCELSSFSLLFDLGTFLLPIGRFGSFVWLIAAGAAIPRGTELLGKKEEIHARE